MKYFSLNNPNKKASFKEAVIRGIAPDKGLYFPEEIPRLPEDYWQAISTLETEELAYRAIENFVSDEIPEVTLRKIIQEVLHFPFPIETLADNLGILELFHGPTLAFKDVGAKFMAGCLGYFLQDEKEEVTVLVATSGDTGGAVANGFLGVDGVKVVILYPSGKVSDVQERQLTTLGQNITALEVHGTFDDCQAMVKNAFLDVDLKKHRKLTSANSINVARWLPQMFYYLLAYQKLSLEGKRIAFCVPSGNFGNICAGMVAHKMGMPVEKFIAATNSNNTVPRFMNNGVYQPQQTIPTISNAMDVSDPSNFVRIQKLFGSTPEDLSHILESVHFSDEQTRACMKEVYHSKKYILDPHGAVGYLGIQSYLHEHPEHYGVVLETAHPIKFLPTVEQTLGFSPDVPSVIKDLMNKQKVSYPINHYQDLKEYLLNN